MRPIPEIGQMTPEQIMRKQPFRIPIPPNFTWGPIVNSAKISVVPLQDIKSIVRSQADFVCEYNVTSHLINSIKYYPNSVFINQTEGKYQAKVRSRIAIGFQERIKTKRKTALLGNNIGMKVISNRSNYKADDILSRYREGWEEHNLEIAIDNAFDSDYITADCAVYIYLDNQKTGWRVFSYKDGDILYPHFHPITGEIVLLGRKYWVEDWNGDQKCYLDVIDRTNFATYVQNDVGTWELEGKPEPHGFPMCPVAYHRRNLGPVWASSQPLIDGYELAISQFAENNAAYALRILYTLGGDMEVLSNTDGTPARIDSSDSNAKVGFLEPAEGADGAFAKQLEIMEKNIMRGSFAVETPELKSGSDTSSLTVKMLFADSFTKALEDSQEYQPFLDRVATLFRHAYSVEIGKASDFEQFIIKPYLSPYVFMSESDIVNALVQLTAAGVLSRQTATEIAYDTGYGTAEEWSRILQEAHDQLVADQQAQTSTKNNTVNQSRTNA